jgi:coenzyme F420-0:L-glutamate ligase/coenzyme F420-1:gamma-L-glutamate ligase
MRMDEIINDYHLFLRSRRSIRRFKSDPVPIEIIQRILETAIYAPSAHNLQPWRFVVLCTGEMKEQLAEAIAAKFRLDMIVDGVPEIDIQAKVGQTIRRAKEAPVIIILCRDKTNIKPQLDSFRRQAEALMGIQSVALSGLQILLAACAEGLAGNWICWPLYAPKETRCALELSSDWEPQGMIFLGYPAETPELPARKSLQEVVRFL